MLGTSSETPNRRLKKTKAYAPSLLESEPPNRQLILGLEESIGNDTNRRKAEMALPPRFLGGVFYWVIFVLNSNQLIYNNILDMCQWCWSFMWKNTRFNYFTVRTFEFLSR
tara:strand:+ start:8735 stop:9067 length:333 start_codon:yes stop_codon:yes gene_type:complete